MEQTSAVNHQKYHKVPTRQLSYQNHQSQLSDTTPTTVAEATTVTTAVLPPEPAKPTKNSICLLKTAVAHITAGGIHIEANILCFDEGAQRSFITEKLANTLRISPHTSENVSISAFGDKLSSSTQLGVATINVVTLEGEQIPISVLIVLVIAAPLHNTYHNYLTHLKYLQGLRLANPVTKSNFKNRFVDWSRLLLAVCG